MTAEKTIETATATVELRNDGIVEIRMKDGAEETLETVKQIERATLELAEGTVSILAVLGGMKSVTAEARYYIGRSDALSGHIRRSALVVASPVSRVIGNVYLMLSSSRTPTRIFTSEADAVAWLAEAGG